MKVVYLLNIFPKISETFILNEILSMQKKGVVVEVLAYKDEKEGRVHPRAVEVPFRYFQKQTLWRKLAAHLYWLRRFPARYLKTWAFVVLRGDGVRKLFVWELTDLVTVHRTAPDHVHAHFGDEASNTAMLYHVLSGVPFSFTTHSYDIFVSRYDNWKVKSALAVKHVTISEYNKGFLTDMYGVDPEDMAIIHCGVDFGRIPAHFEPREEGMIFTAARLHPEKGLDVMVQAVRLLKETGIPMKWLIAGEGDERKELEKLIAKFGLEDRIVLLGNQTHEEVFHYLERASIFVLPSRSEGIPVSLMEAMAFRLPVIATSICGIPELIEDGVSGFLVKPDRPESLAEKIKLLLQDRALRERFAESGYQKVHADFNLQKETDRLLALWKGKSGR